MERPQSELLLQHIRRLADRDAAAGSSDAELLRRFLGEGDEAAFTALVQRHGAMVWQVCMSALAQREDAEDIHPTACAFLRFPVFSRRSP
jgi:hypothetical protein